MLQILKHTLRILALALGAMAIAAMFLAALGLSAGCSRTVYLPQTSTAVSSDTVRLIAWRTDSILIRDSVGSHRSGDTVFITRWRERSRIITLRDTFFTAHADSLKEVMTVSPQGFSGSSSTSSRSPSVATVIIVVCVCIAVVVVCVSLSRIRK